MLKNERQTKILDLLEKNHLVTINNLSQELDVSYMTIWRDLEAMEQAGQLKRIRGGAISLQTRSDDIFTASPVEDEFFASINSPNRRILGRYAAQEMVQAGDIITLEAGSTVSSMAPFLQHSNLTILTNGLWTASTIFPALQKITLMCSGGILIDTGAFIGPQAEEFFARFRVQKAFVGAQGLTLEDGFTDATPLYTNLKKVIKNNSEKLIVMIDSNKIDHRSLVPVMTLDEVDAIITDSGAPAEIVSHLRQEGIEVHIADQEQA
jgi:DeoR/GlpR family transcriptional regulator of sugar metabolism